MDLARCVHPNRTHDFCEILDVDLSGGTPIDCSILLKVINKAPRTVLQNESSRWVRERPWKLSHTICIGIQLSLLLRGSRYSPTFHILIPSRLSRNAEKRCSYPQYLSNWAEQVKSFLDLPFIVQFLRGRVRLVFNWFGWGKGGDIGPPSQVLSARMASGEGVFPRTGHLLFLTK